MHKEVVTHIALSTISEIIISASSDGVIKLWRKIFHGIEFVKSYRAHKAPITTLTISGNGSKALSLSSKDQSLILFDTINSDIITTIFDQRVCAMDC